MNTRFALVLLISLGFGLAQAKATDINPNAGTGPYEFGPQTGMTGQNNSIWPLVHSLVGLVDHIAHGKGDPPTELDKLQCETDKEFSYRKSFLQTLNSLFTSIRAGLAKNPKDPGLQTSLNNLYEILKKDAQNKDRIERIATLKSGFFFRSNASYEFDTFVESFGDHNKHGLAYDAFITAGVYLPLTNSPGTGRLGGGLAFGDPDSLVEVVGAQAFLSPFAYDLYGSVSFGKTVEPGKKVDPQKTVDPAKEDQQLSDIPNTRTLVDHIRPGDTWLTLSGGQITGSTDQDALPNATYGEAELLFALPQRYAGTYETTTFAVSGIYSANKDLGIDEMGLAYRTPITSGTRPVFLSARYGTRGHYTLSIDFKF